MMDQQTMKKYAQMLLRTGINLDRGQDLVLNADVEAAPLVRELTAQAYEMGAREVHINWSDTACERARYLKQSEETLRTVPDWKAEMYNSYARGGCGYMRVVSEDPDAMRGVDAGRIALARKALSAATHEAENCRMTGISPWLVAAYPGKQWACRVFPGLDADQAVEKLWQAILCASRADAPDPAAAWEAHQRNLSRRVRWLNEQQFVSFHYRTGLGTDFTVGMPEGQNWAGGGSLLKNGRSYVPNMPTEEVFASPDRSAAQGRLVASLPLNHNGVLIEDFWFEFKDGKVVDYGARAGREALTAILDTDEGAAHLGEIALIPADSPLAMMGLLFYNTLFDENASCHFALGRAYAECLRGGEEMTEEQLLAAGLNQSLTHVDFMVGTKDLEITGVRADGSRVPVFAGGVWAQD